MRPTPPPVFSRRSFLFFILLAPACLAAVGGIVGVLQYKQYRAMVSPEALVPAFAATEGDLSRVDSLTAAFAAFSRGEGPDTLRLFPRDLTLLASSGAAGSAVAAIHEQGFRFRFTPGDSLLVVESSRGVDALSGRLAWLFKRFAPVEDGWLNARMEGRPEWKSGVLSFAPERGLLNETKVPRAALTKRGGLSPKDFLDPRFEPEYAAFLAALDTVAYEDGEVLIVRKANYELRITN